MQAVRLWIDRGSLQLAQVEWTAGQTVQLQLLRSLGASTLTDAQPGLCGRLPRFEENLFATVWRLQAQCRHMVDVSFKSGARSPVLSSRHVLHRETSRKTRRGPCRVKGLQCNWPNLHAPLGKHFRGIYTTSLMHRTTWDWDRAHPCRLDSHVTKTTRAIKQAQLYATLQLVCDCKPHI